MFTCTVPVLASHCVASLIIFVSVLLSTGYGVLKLDIKTKSQSGVVSTSASQCYVQAFLSTLCELLCDSSCIFCLNALNVIIIRSLTPSNLVHVLWCDV